MGQTVTCGVKESDVRAELTAELDHLHDRNKELESERDGLVACLNDTDEVLPSLLPPEWMWKKGLTPSQAVESLETLLIKERRNRLTQERLMDELAVAYKDVILKNKLLFAENQELRIKVKNLQRIESMEKYLQEVKNNPDCLSDVASILTRDSPDRMNSQSGSVSESPRLSSLKTSDESEEMKSASSKNSGVDVHPTSLFKSKTSPPAVQPSTDVSVEQSPSPVSKSVAKIPLPSSRIPVLKSKSATASLSKSPQPQSHKTSLEKSNSQTHDSITREGSLRTNLSGRRVIKKIVKKTSQASLRTAG